jgi:hypothetical protein
VLCFRELAESVVKNNVISSCYNAVKISGTAILSIAFTRLDNRRMVP